jgi:hypothetical protein
MRQLEKTVEMLKKYTKTPAQKKLAKTAFVDSSDWHYWANSISDKYIAMVRYALRRVGKGQDLAVLQNIYRKHPLWKTPFLRYLEYVAATKDRDAWTKDRTPAYRMYGMTTEEATARANNYRDLLIGEFA